MSFIKIQTKEGRLLVQIGAWGRFLVLYVDDKFVLSRSFLGNDTDGTSSVSCRVAEAVGADEFIQGSYLEYFVEYNGLGDRLRIRWPGLMLTCLLRRLLVAKLEAVI